MGSICWSGGSRGSGLYIEAIQGASPSGGTWWPVDGRALWPKPEEVGRGRASVEDVRGLEPEVGRGVPLETPAGAFRAPEVGVDLLGRRAFGGEFSFAFTMPELAGLEGV